MPMMLCAAAHAWRRTAVRSGGSVGVKEGTHLCLGPVAGNCTDDVLRSGHVRVAASGLHTTGLMLAVVDSAVGDKLDVPPVSERKVARTRELDSYNDAVGVVVRIRSLRPARASRRLGRYIKSQNTEKGYGSHWVLSHPGLHLPPRTHTSPSLSEARTGPGPWSARLGTPRRLAANYPSTGLYIVACHVSPKSQINCGAVLLFYP